MSKKIYLIIISLIILITVGEAYPQAVIIQVSPDGSLVIQDRYGGETKRALEGKNVVDMVASQWNVQIIRGSSDGLADQTIITRGRAGHKRQLNAAYVSSLSTFSQAFTAALKPFQVTVGPYSGYAHLLFN